MTAGDVLGLLFDRGHVVDGIGEPETAALETDHRGVDTGSPADPSVQTIGVEMEEVVFR